MNNFPEFGESPTKDNAELNQFEIAWLAGIFDGEGSVGFHRDNRRGDTYSLCLHITNTSIELLTKCLNIIFSLTGEFRKLYKKPIYDTQLKTNLDVYTIDIRKQEPILKVFKAIEPYLTCKRERVRFAIQILEKRLKELELNGHHSKWSEETLNLCKKAQELVSVETKRKTPILRG